jgi:hypothetical protein
VTVFHWLSLVFRIKMMHLAFVPGENFAQEFVTFTFISQQQFSANVHTLLFQFLSEHSERHRAHNFRYPRSAILPALAHFCLLLQISNIACTRSLLFATACLETRRVFLIVLSSRFPWASSVAFRVSRYATWHFPGSNLHPPTGSSDWNFLWTAVD